jgi:hypothetical protein
MENVPSEVWEGLTNLVNEALRIRLFIRVNVVKIICGAWVDAQLKIMSRIRNSKIRHSIYGDGMNRLLFEEDPRDKEVKVKSCAMSKLFRSSMSRYC